MRANRWFCLQLAVLSVSTTAWAQSNLRPTLLRTQQDSLPTPPAVHFQRINENTRVHRVNPELVQTFPQQLQQPQQPRFQPVSVQDPNIQQENSRAIELHQQFRDSVAQAVNERLKISELEANAQNVRGGVHNKPVNQVPVQQFQVQGPQRLSPAPVQQQRKLLNQQDQQRRPVAPVQHRFQQQVTQPQFQEQTSTPLQQTFSPVVQRTLPTQPEFQGQRAELPLLPRALAKPVAQRPDDVSQREEELFKKQAENAHYTFNTAIVDGIMDVSQVRQETRDGLNVEGLYSYSDGFFKRTVHYEADENGYRIVKEEVDPIGEGPQVDLAGTAEVNTNVAGVNSRYSITAADIPQLLQERP